MTRLRGDKVVKDWLVLLEQSERTWKDELAVRRRKKFAVSLGGQTHRRRRALSKEAIEDLRRYILDGKRGNEITWKAKEIGCEGRGQSPVNDKNSIEGELIDMNGEQSRVLLGSEVARRRLSKETIKDLNTYIRDCKTVNETTSREKELGSEVMDKICQNL